MTTHPLKTSNNANLSHVTSLTSTWNFQTGTTQYLKELFIKHYENLMNHHKRISICLFFKILQLNRKNYVNNWSKTNKNFPISGLLASFPEQINIMCLVFLMYFASNRSYAASKIIFSKNMQPLSKYFRKHLKTAIFFLSAENDDVINP